jgi:hypothetical protein
LLVGTNRDEHKLYVAPDRAAIDEAELERQVRELRYTPITSFARAAEQRARHRRRGRDGVALSHPGDATL